MSTIKDIANKVGVSFATVSNALNGRSNVSDDMRARILEAAKQLNYVPNINAKLMKTRNSKNIGLFLPYLHASFYINLIQETFTHCNRAGYSLLIHVSRDIDSQLLLSNILSHNIDAAIVLSDRFPDEYVPMLHKRDVPVVFLDREIAQPMISSVVINNDLGIRQSLEYLQRTGHKRIAHLYGLNNYDGNRRREAFFRHLEEFNLTADEEWTMCGHFSRYAAYSAIRGKASMNIKQLPDAFVCADSETALGCIQALRDEGMDVPRDTSVIGFTTIDGIPTEADYIAAARYMMHDLARTAVISLTDMLNNKTEGTIKTVDTQFFAGATIRFRN